ncbi:hypothetical protein JNM87_05320 [Candidatus Saccharibacteria bacterium]|nr:hypothetical protein [Candidatus Saccharibacteria bacterium]
MIRKVILYFFGVSFMIHALTIFSKNRYMEALVWLTLGAIIFCLGLFSSKQKK